MEKRSGSIAVSSASSISMPDCEATGESPCELGLSVVSSQTVTSGSALCALGEHMSESFCTVGGRGANRRILAEHSIVHDIRRMWCKFLPERCHFCMLLREVPPNKQLFSEIRVLFLSGPSSLSHCARLSEEMPEAPRGADFMQKQTSTVPLE